VLGSRALGAGMHRHHHDVGAAVGLVDQAGRRAVVVQRAGVGIAGDADEGDGQPRTFT